MGLVALALAFATGGTATAQWVSVPVPGTPRTSDGVPDLEAPTPRTAGGKPDLSGIWRAESYQWVNHLLPPGEVEPFQPWAAELAERRRSTQSHELPMTFCMPHGVPDAQLVHGHPFKIVQTPNLMIHLYEEFTKYRQIHTDGRELPVDPNPAWYGYSVGHWEDDTFVVESAGFKLGSWLTNQGAPHTEALRVHRALPSGELRLYGDRRHDRRSRGVHGTLDLGHDSHASLTRHGVDRASVREQQGSGAPIGHIRWRATTRHSGERTIKARLTFIIGIAMAAVSGQIMAHHSFRAAFDPDKPVSVTGTVTSIEWLNPHTWFFVDVEDPDGTVTNWAFELASSESTHAARLDASLDGGW